MPGLRYLDFDLAFQRQDRGYVVRILDSPAGQAAGDFVVPFSDLEIENFLLRFGRTQQTVRRLAAPQIEAARAFGTRLFEASFQNEVRSCLRSSLDEALRQGAGLRLRLRLTEAPELNDLPWEFLLQPALGRFLALSAETPLVRYLDLPERVRPLGVKPPLEVLAVISSPADYAPLDVEEEWRKVEGAVAELRGRGLLRLHRLVSPTLPELQRWLRRETCHVLHFIGHGGFDPRTEEGLLLFADEAGRGREIAGAELGTLLHDHRPLRLAVLNACEGARSSRSDPFAGVAQSLVREGIPAVIAMQFEITDRAAIDFAHELYGAVVDGYPIDAALGEARKALYLGGHELEWGTPVLYMRSPDGQLFEIAPAAKPSPAPRPRRWFLLAAIAVLAVLATVYLMTRGDEKGPIHEPVPEPATVPTSGAPAVQGVRSVIANPEPAGSSDVSGEEAKATGLNLQEIRQLNLQIESNPEDAAAILKLANLNFDLRNWQSAQSLYERYLKLKPRDALVRSDLGICYRELKQPERALSELRLAQTLDPKDWRFLYNEALVLGLDLNRLDDAMSVLARLQKMEPDNHEVLRLSQEIVRRWSAGASKP